MMSGKTVDFEIRMRSCFNFISMRRRKLLELAAYKMSHYVATEQLNLSEAARYRAEAVMGSYRAVHESNDGN